jgi:hypothetical protein
MKRSFTIFAAALALATTALGFAPIALAQYANAITVQRALTVPPNGGSYADVNINCPAGYIALSGGLDNLNSGSFEITALAPTFGNVALFAQADGTRGAADGWYASVINYDSAAHPVTVSAVCVPVPDGVVVVVGSTGVTAVANNEAGGGFVAVACPSGTVAVGGGVDISRPEAMKLISSSPWWASGATYLTERTAGINPAPDGWAGLTSNQGPNAGTMKVAAVCANLATVVSIVSPTISIGVAENNGTTVVCPAGYIATGGGFDSNDPHSLIGTVSTPVYNGFGFAAERGDGQYGAAAGWYANTFSHAASGAHALAIGVICLGIDFLPPENIVTVYEFYNTNLRHYFRTSSAAEADAIDNGSAGAGWLRTGDNFTAFAPGGSALGQDVCRFYTFGANSHFYTAFADECEFLKSPTSGWTYEELSFRIQLPAASTCPDGTVPVYRLYNDRFAFNDSNHRFTTWFSEVAPLQAQGWVYEGVAFCARNYSGG